MKTTFTARNTEKAARISARHTGQICVRFPFNDYYRGPGKVFTGEPTEHRVPRFRDGEVFVKYNRREYRVSAFVYTWVASDGSRMRRKDGRLCRAYVFFSAS